MKFLKVFTILMFFSFLGAAFMQNSSAQGFTITSNSFSNGQTMPQKQIYNQFGCGGENISPQLSWSGAPAGTKSFALIVHDPDAPRPTGWYHWIVLNIPSNVTSLKEGQQINHPMMQVKNDFGKVTYGGACPPKGHGVHHYNFTIYALDAAALIPTPGSTPDAVKRQVERKALASATITVLYSRE